MSCAKTAELIDMSFWMKTGGADSPREGAILGALRAVQKHWQFLLQPSQPRSPQKGSFNH